MKAMNEKQLRGWRPRRPSRALKSRIFSARDEADLPAWNWNCAAPAMVCVLFAMMLFHFNTGVVWPEPKPAMAMLSSNENRAASFSDSAQEVQNHVACVTFDWTNHTGFKSSIGFTPTTNLSN
jgi:hypothetical protein